MARKDLLDSINIPEPCSQDWDAMRGGASSKFCDSCEKDVYNLSEMTRRQAKKLILQTNANVCVRMEKDADGRVQTLKKQIHQITRQLPMAAGVLTASLAFAAATHAQKKPPRPPVGKVAVNNILNPQSTASISGTITDANGALVPNVSIILRDAKSKKIRRTTADENGFYEFKNVRESVYEIEVKAANGFRRFLSQDVKISGDEKSDSPIVLETSARRVLMGFAQ